MTRPIEPDCIQLLKTIQTVILSTASDKGMHASYAPYICLAGKLYILVSELAQHTANLRVGSHAGCMLIEDELQAEQILARRRLMIKSTVVEIDRNDKQWPVIIHCFRDRFGEIIELLDSLPDFTVFKLNADEVVLVRGFGDAHQISGLQFEQSIHELKV